MSYEELADELFHYLAEKPHKPVENDMIQASRGEVMVLGYLAGSERTATSGELSEQLKKTTARTANILKSLERKGFITRMVHPDDRRKIIVSITKIGKDYADFKKQEMVSELTEILRALGEEDAKEHVRLMKRVYEIIHKQNEKNNNA